MRKDFPNQQTLEMMPIHRIRLIDIKERDEEELVQRVLSKKLSATPPTVQINFHIPDIKTKQEEEYWQRKIDEAKAQQQKQISGQVAEPEPVVVEPTPQPEVTEVPPVKEEDTKPVEVVAKRRDAKHGLRGRKPKTK